MAGEKFPVAIFNEGERAVKWGIEHLPGAYYVEMMPLFEVKEEVKIEVKVEKPKEKEKPIKVKKIKPVDEESGEN